MKWSLNKNDENKLTVIKETDDGFNLSNDGTPFIKKNSIEDCINQCKIWSDRSCNAISYFNKNNEKQCKLYKFDKDIIDKSNSNYNSIYGQVYCNNNYKNLECCGNTVWSEKNYSPNNPITIPWCPKPQIFSNINN